ncbi:MAG: ATPase, T2SS/T4P/T4SS family [Candidatus Hermodarchaeota archaeon]
MSTSSSIIRETYPLIPPFAHALIQTDPNTRETVYKVVETGLRSHERKVYNTIVNFLYEEIDQDFNELRKKGEGEDEKYLISKVREIVKNYRIAIDDKVLDKIFYFIKRDFIGFGRIEPIFKDHLIEDIDCDGPGIPIFVYHREHERIPTNIIFDDEDELDSFVIKLAQRAGRHISVASPLLDASLPDGSRIQLTYQKEVTARGSTFTVRKFRSDPMTIVDLIQFNSIDEFQTAYFWMALEFKKSILIAGGTASGKTTLLNSLAMFTKPGAKIVSIEDSVSADSELWFYRNNKFERSTISDLVDELFELYGYQNSAGYEVLSENPEDIKVFSMTSSGKIQLSAVSSFIRHKVKKQGIEIVTTSGRRIKVTKDHSLFTLSPEGNISPIDADSLQIGSRITVPRFLPFNSHTNDDPKAINLLQHLEILRKYYVEGEPIKAVLNSYKDFLVNELGLNENTFKWRLRSNVISCEHLDAILKKGHSFSSEEISALSLRGKSGGARIPLIIPITDRLLEIVGLWIAEGCYDLNSILITNRAEECRNVIHAFGRDLNLTPSNHSDGATLMLNSAILKILFQDVLELTGHAETKRIPTWIFNLPNAKIAKVLSGLFSGDSYVGKYEIEYSSQSIELLKDIQTLLLRFNIQARLPPSPYEKDKTYKLRISSVPQLDSFKTHIGYLQDYKTKNLDISADRSSIHDNTDTIPLSLDIIDQLKAITGNQFNFASYENRLQSNLGRRYLQKIVSYLEETEPHIIQNSDTQTTTIVEQTMIPAVYQDLKNLAHSDLLWDEIKEIRWFKFDDEYVYDLSVPENESFITENVVAHNTAEINIPHENWIPSVARTGFGATEADGRKRGEIDLFDLLRAALRQRPDYLFVGEVRGAEAGTMFQAMATGHAGMGTIHGDSVAGVIRRLESNPMNIPRALIQSLNIIDVQRRVQRGNKMVRRSIEIVEVVGMDPVTGDLITNRTFAWNPRNDTFTYFGRSYVFEDIMNQQGMTEHELMAELERRQLIIKWMVKKGINYYKDVAQVVRDYYARPEEMIVQCKKDLKAV